MSRTVTLNLDSIDICQILDALDSRAESYEKTVAILNGRAFRKLKKLDPPEARRMALLELYFSGEECRDSEEAAEIARHFRDIIATINQQFNVPTNRK